MTRRMLREAREWERRFKTDRKFRERVLRRSKKMEFFESTFGVGTGRPWHRQRRPFGTTAPEMFAILMESYRRQTRRD